MSKAILPGLLFFLAAAGVFADATQHCAICDRPLLAGDPMWLLKAETSLEKYYIETGAIRPDQTRVQKDPDLEKKIAAGTYILLCKECNEIKVSCSLCGLPVRSGSIVTGDGRIICRREAGDVVMDEATARQVFETATRMARYTVGLDFGLRQPNVTVQIFDINDWATIKENGAEVLHKIGHSKSRMVNSNLVHYVGLYSGQRKSDVVYTCIHEYMHLWLNENMGQHQIEQNTGEALCELLAYKVALAEHDSYAQQRLLDNPYTHGRIRDLIEVERQHGMYYILDWVKNGTTRTLDETEAALAKPVNPPSHPSQAITQSSVSYAPSTEPAPEADELLLKGMFRTGEQRTAILNGGVAVASGDSATVFLKKGRVKLKCLEVRDASVVLQLDGSTNTITLEME